jgi:microcompartment protein CcmK/EutM
MILARIDGHATATIAHSSLKGRKLVLCTPVDEAGNTAGSPFAALDPLGAGQHSTVLISTDGSWTQQWVGDDHSPLRNQIICIVDPQ